MRIIRAKDYADVSRKAANIIASVIQLHPDFTLVADETALSLVQDLL